MKTKLNTLTSLVLALGVGLAVGCSKSGEDSTAGVDASGNAAAPAVPEKGNPEAARAVSAATAAMEKNDYDAAISALMAAQSADAPMSDAQKNEYHKAVREVTLRLVEAADSDPKAKEAYDNLSRLMTRR